MITEKQIDGQTEKFEETVWKINTGIKQYQVCVQVPEWEAISRLLTIARINRNPAVIQLAINLKGSFSTTFQLTLRLRRVFMHLFILFSR